MKSSAVVQSASLVIFAVLLGPGPVSSAQGDVRMIEGVVEWIPAPGGPPFVIVRADDGRQIYADLARIQTAAPPVNRGDRIAINGVEGLNPHEVVATAVTAIARAGSQPAQPSAAPPPPPGPAAVAPAPAPSPEQPAERPPDRLDGRVRTVSGQRVVLRTVGGHDVKIEMPTGEIATVLRPGDDITVFGRREGERFVATGFIRVEPPTGSALPRQPR